MSLITRNNYEAFMLDYVEENLSPELIAALMLFLENNPDLKEDLADFEIHELSPLDEVFSNKNELKKDVGIISTSNYEAFIITEIEGENDIETSKALHLFLAQHPTLQKEFIAFQQTKLIAPNVVFEDKESLKKKEGVVIPMYWWYSSAAAVLLILFLVNGFEDNKQVYFPIADKDNITAPQKNDTSSFVTQVELKKLHTEPINQVIQISKKRNNKKQFNPINKKKEAKLNQIADVKKNIVEDSISKPQHKDNTAIRLEEDIYANVKIVYEEDKPQTNIDNKSKKKITKLNMASTLVKHQVNQNINKGKEKILLALNTKPFNFLKKRKKK